jgi:hypothetical protein
MFGSKKVQERFWKRILIVDDDTDITVTFKEVIEESNKKNSVNKKIEVHTSNNPVVALSEFKQNFYRLTYFPISKMLQLFCNCSATFSPSVLAI